MSEDALPMLERYELKYTIPSDMVGPITEFVRPYCFPDSYSDWSPDGYYQVNSLYFDSPDYLFLRNRLGGCENRFNMRVRTYTNKPSFPYFLEVKQKQGDIIRKYRSRVRTGDLQTVLDPASEIGGFLLDGGETWNADLFRRLTHAHNAVPVVMTSYLRRAFISNCDDYARVTFDKGLRFKEQRDYRPMDVAGMAPSDVETLYDEGCDVILELKCYSKYVPLWMVDLIRTFQLRRRSFSKYTAGASQVFQRQSFDDSLRASPHAAFGKGWTEA